MSVTVANIMERIESAGVPESYVRSNILPHWWSAECDIAADHNHDMILIVKFAVARAFGIDLEALSDEDAELTLKLDYAPQTLIDALKPERRGTYLGLLVGNEGDIVEVNA